IRLEVKGRDKPLTLTVGKVSIGKDAVAYVASSDWGDKPLAVNKLDIEAALEDTGYFRNKDLLGENAAMEAQALKLQRGETDVVPLRKEEERWRFVEPAYGEAEIDSTFLGNLAGLKVQYRSEKDNDFVKDNVTDLAKVDKSLAKEQPLRITVTSGKGKAQTT